VSLGFGTGTAASDAIRTVFEAAVLRPAIDASNYTLSSPNAFPAGRNGTTYAKSRGADRTAGYTRLLRQRRHAICRAATDLTVAVRNSNTSTRPHHRRVDGGINRPALLAERFVSFANRATRCRLYVALGTT